MSECEKYEIHKIRDQQICVVKLGSKFKIGIIEVEDKAKSYVMRDYIVNEIFLHILHKILRNFLLAS